jgi:hypothetical protein
MSQNSVMKEVNSDFKWFEYIITWVTEELLSQTDYQNKYDFEKELLQILAIWHTWSAWWQFDIRYMQEYIEACDDMNHNFYLLYTSEVCRGLLSYLNIFGTLRLPNHTIPLLHLGDTVVNIWEALKQEWRKYEYFDTIYDYISYIDPNILRTLSPVSLTETLLRYHVDVSDIYTFLLWSSHIAAHDIWSYIDNILSDGSPWYHRDAQLFDINVSWVTHKIGIIAYINMSKELKIKVVHSGFLQQDCEQIRRSYGHVFILRKPKLSLGS